MPVFVYQCPDGHITELYFPKHTRVTRGCGHRSSQGIGTCDLMVEQIITAPMLVKVAADVCYDSPIDGSHITSWEKRKEDLKKNGCSPYDPCIKKDYHARIARDEAEMDKSIEEHVEASIEKMPGHQRAQLASEMIDQGKDLNVQRLTHHG